LVKQEEHQQAATPPLEDSIESAGNGSREQQEAAAHAPANTNITNFPAPAHALAHAPSQESESALRQQRRFSETDQHKKLQARKALFEKERDEILSDIPYSVQDRFGQIFFTKWGTNFMPCLALNPFSVPPGPVRDMWYEMYEKVSS
jgi:hypothetical protein